MGYLGGSDSKESACSARDPRSIPGSGRSPGEENGTPLQYSCLENPMDRGAWWATVHGVAKDRTRLSDQAHSYSHLYIWDLRLPIPELPGSSTSELDCVSPPPTAYKSKFFCSPGSQLPLILLLPGFQSVLVIFFI